MVEVHNDSLPAVPKSVAYRVMELPGRMLLGSFSRLITRTCEDKVFFDVAAFPWAREVEAAYPEIRAELDWLLAERAQEIPDLTEVFPEQAQIAQRAQWKTYFFRLYGHDLPENRARCPETARALEKIPNLRTAFFSMLEPGGALTYHRGPYKGVLRYHLGLRTPTPPELCGIEFGEERRSWQEGRSLIFDDTHPHRAWNDSDTIRVVLFVDFDRPMPPPLRAMHLALFGLLRRSPFIVRVVRNLQQQGKPAASGGNGT